VQLEPATTQQAGQVMADGFVVLVAQDCAPLCIELRGGAMRGADSPGVDRTIYAAHEGFTETLQFNFGALRRRYHDTALCTHSFVVGKMTRLQGMVVYDERVAAPELVQRVRDMLAGFVVDNITTISGLIPYFSQGTRPFPGARLTERPDVAVAALCEGRVAVILDQSPFALVLPCVLTDLFQSADDVGEQPALASLTRIMRWVGFFASILLPGLYISMMLFHQTLVPPGLLAMLTNAARQVPIPLLGEVLLVELLMLLILESTARLPNVTAQALGIVGGVVLGQALITVRLATAPTVILITFCTLAISSLPNPHLLNTGRLLRLCLILVCAAFGLFGLTLGLLVILVLLARAERFSTPYLAPLAPGQASLWNEALFQRPEPKKHGRMPWPVK